MRQYCGAAILRSQSPIRGSKIANFPVKFPVCRELARETGSHLTASATTHCQDVHKTKLWRTRNRVRLSYPEQLYLVPLCVQSEGYFDSNEHGRGDNEE